MASGSAAQRAATAAAGAGTATVTMFRHGDIGGREVDIEFGNVRAFAPDAHTQHLIEITVVNITLSVNT